MLQNHHRNLSLNRRPICPFLDDLCLFLSNNDCTLHRMGLLKSHNLAYCCPDGTHFNISHLGRMRSLHDCRHHALSHLALLHKYACSCTRPHLVSWCMNMPGMSTHLLELFRKILVIDIMLPKDFIFISCCCALQTSHTLSYQIYSCTIDADPILASTVQQLQSSGS